MELKSTYMITQFLMYMVGYYDRSGKMCTLVKEVNRTFLVNQSPLEILAYSIQCIGFDLPGAFSSSKLILGDDIHMHPVMVNPIHKICLFPTKSAKHEETIWFNPFYINRTSGCIRKTIVQFRNGHTLKVYSILSSFNHKLKTAEQLRNTTVENGKDPTCIVLDFKKRPSKSKRRKLKYRIGG